MCTERLIISLKETDSEKELKIYKNMGLFPQEFLSQYKFFRNLCMQITDQRKLFTAMLSAHVQNFVLIWVLDTKLENNTFLYYSENFERVWGKSLGILFDIQIPL